MIFPLPDGNPPLMSRFRDSSCHDQMSFDKHTPTYSAKRDMAISIMQRFGRPKPQTSPFELFGDQQGSPTDSWANPPTPGILVQGDSAHEDAVTEDHISRCALFRCPGGQHRTTLAGPKPQAPSYERSSWSIACLAPIAPCKRPLH